MALKAKIFVFGLNTQETEEMENVIDLKQYSKKAQQFILFVFSDTPADVNVQCAWTVGAVSTETQHILTSLLAVYAVVYPYLQPSVCVRNNTYRVSFAGNSVTTLWRPRYYTFVRTLVNIT